MRLDESYRKVVLLVRMVDKSFRSGIPTDERPEGRADEDLHPQAVRRELGLAAELVYLGEDLAPPVDRALLLDFAEKRLTPDDDDLVAERIVSFRSWGAAYSEILLGRAEREVKKEIGDLLRGDNAEQ